MQSPENRAFAITQRLEKINPSYSDFATKFFVTFDEDSSKGTKSDDYRTFTDNELRTKFVSRWHDLFIKENYIWYGWLVQCFHELKKNGKYGDPQQDMLDYILDSLP